MLRFHALHILFTTLVDRTCTISGSATLIMRNWISQRCSQRCKPWESQVRQFFFHTWNAGSLPHRSFCCT